MLVNVSIDVSKLLLCNVSLGEGEPFTLSSDEVEEQAVQCNRKKKAAKIVGVGKICVVHITVH